MTVITTTHLNFTGAARAALEFYRSVFGGDVAVATYGDFGMPSQAPGAGDVVFGQVQSESGFRVMAYDIPGRGAESPLAASDTHRHDGATVTNSPFFVSIRGESLAEIDGYWRALSESATVIEPLAASAWSPGFGMLRDRFGVTWILDVQADVAAQPS